MSKRKRVENRKLLSCAIIGMLPIGAKELG
jgi:hypothetical protein